jgi:ribonuclease HIII
LRVTSRGLGDVYKRQLPKGSGSEAKNAGIELVGRLGPAILVNFAKLHFKTAYEVRGLEPPESKPFVRRKKAE